MLVKTSWPSGEILSHHFLQSHVEIDPQNLTRDKRPVFSKVVKGDNVQAIASDDLDALIDIVVVIEAEDSYRISDPIKYDLR